MTFSSLEQGWFRKLVVLVRIRNTEPNQATLSY